ncbi:MAG: hypothetical protein BroJett042_31810 [Bacteroidota bacterium]|nr:MAG: hypothetical protein BroJett042_31810 [Bacteroidota bacterium]
MAWRDHPYHYQGYLFLLKPQPVFRARVNMSSISYPFQRLTYDTVTLGAYTDIEPGMTVLLGTSEGADDLGRNRARLSSEGVATATDIYVGQFSRGTRDGEFDLADNAYITVLDDYRVWAKIPRVTDKLVVYKDYKTEYSECEPQPPVANAGVGYAGFTDPSTNVITVDFDGSASFAVAAGASITSYAWDFADGTPSSAATAQVNGVIFPPGFRWVKLTVTDSNGKSHTARVPVLAADPAASDNGVIRQFRVTEHACRREGQEITVEVREAINLADYPAGTLVMYWEREAYAGVAGSLAGPAGREHMKFIGWLDEEPVVIQADEHGTEQYVELRCVDVGGRLNRLPGFPFTLERDSTPTKWHQLKGLNLDRFIWFTLMWHSTALDLADFTWSGTGETYACPSLGGDEGTLWEQAAQRAEAIAHVLTCDRWGRLRMWPNPLLRDVGERTAVVQESLTGADVLDVRYARQEAPRVHWLWGYAVKAQATDADALPTSGLTAFACVAPGKAPGQGAVDTEHNQGLVVDQNELNARTGHRYAVEHNPAESTFEVDLAHGGDAGLDPARLEWIRLTLTAEEAAQRGLTFTNERFLPTEMTIEHDHEAQTKRVSLTLQRERVGTPAATFVLPTGEFEQFEDFYPGDYGFTYPDLGEFWLQANAGSIAAIGMDSYRYLAIDFDVSPVWTRTFLNLLGTPVAFVVDPFSPGYIGGGSAINGWLATTRGIYRLTDIFGASPGLALQYDYGYEISNPGKDVRSAIGIDASFGTPNHVVAVIPQRSDAWGPGKAIYTVDGVNWTAVNLPGGVSGNMSMGAYGVYVSPRTPGLVYATALDTDGYTAHNYISTNYGQTWSRMYSHGPRHPYMQYLNLRGSVCIHVPYADNPDEDDLYYVRHNVGSNLDSNKVRRIVDGVDTDITPTYLGENKWGPQRTRWGLMTAPLDRNRLVMIASMVFQGHYLFTSKDEGTSWQVYGPTSARMVAIAGDDPDALYLWGANGYIAYSPDFGVTIQSKVGNMGSFDPAPGEIIGICGGPTT